jgi:hypothetical protein
MKRNLATMFFMPSGMNRSVEKRMNKQLVRSIEDKKKYKRSPARLEE